MLCLSLERERVREREREIEIEGEYAVIKAQKHVSKDRDPDFFAFKC